MLACCMLYVDFHSWEWPVVICSLWCSSLETEDWLMFTELNVSTVLPCTSLHHLKFKNIRTLLSFITYSW